MYFTSEIRPVVTASTPDTLTPALQLSTSSGSKTLLYGLQGNIIQLIFLKKNPNKELIFFNGPYNVLSK